jgi:hypothetical protein
VTLAGSVSFLACTPAMCAANTQCASVHCNCCGPDCSWPKNSQESHKRVTKCNQECPLITASKSVTIRTPQPLVMLLDADQVQPFLVADVAPITPSVSEPPNLHSATLLNLACALTI